MLSETALHFLARRCESIVFRLLLRPVLTESKNKTFCLIRFGDDMEMNMRDVLERELPVVLHNVVLWHPSGQRDFLDDGPNIAKVLVRQVPESLRVVLGNDLGMPFGSWHDVKKTEAVFSFIHFMTRYGPFQDAAEQARWIFLGGHRL